MQGRIIRVFIASPGDVEPEREALGEALESLSGGDSDVAFERLGWESLPAISGARTQAAINGLVDTCDVFILVMARAWGRAASDAAVATSYTEEEFRRAAARFNRTGSPEIFCFFKSLPLEVLADPGPQLQRVLQFRESLETSRHVLYRTFESPTDLRDQIVEHLRLFARGALPIPRTSAQSILLSEPERIGSTPEEWESAAVVARQAVLAASQGKLEEASRLFAVVSQETTDLRLLALAETFFVQWGDSLTAQTIADKRLVLLRDRRAAAFGYISAMPAVADTIIANALPNIPPEHHAMFAAITKEVFGSPEWNDMLAGYLAEHLTVHELVTLARFYRGEGKSVALKAARYMGDAIPRAVEQVNARLRAHGFDV